MSEDEQDPKLVTVNISKSFAPFLSNYLVLFNPTIERLKELVELLPKTFIFPFYTGTIEEVPDFAIAFPEIEIGDDYSSFNYDHLLKPFYIGNFAPTEFEKLAMKYVAHSFKECNWQSGPSGGQSHERSDGQESL